MNWILEILLIIVWSFFQFIYYFFYSFATIFKFFASLVKKSEDKKPDVTPVPDNKPADNASWKDKINNLIKKIFKK
jgi:hypothetical protein